MVVSLLCWRVVLGAGRELEIWFTSRESKKKNNVSFDFAKPCYLKWFTHKWKNFTFQQDNYLKHSSKMISKLLQNKKKEKYFGNYDLAIPNFWPLSHWICMGWTGLESSKRIPKMWRWDFSVDVERLERSAIYFFSKTVRMNAKNL